MTDQTTDDRCPFCGQPAERCTEIREGNAWWLGLHSERADVVALRERQRQVRIALGHETESGLGVLREAVPTSRSTSTADDETMLMLEALARQRRGY